MRTGISTACFYGREYNENALKTIGKMGVGDAELFFSARAEYAPRYLHDVRSICEDEDVRVRSVHAFGTQFEPQLCSIHDRQYEEALGVYHEVLSAAQYLGAHVYVFHGPLYLKRARGFRPDYDFAGSRISRLADIAADYGVALCYETVHWCWYHAPEFAEQLLAHVDSDNLYFTLDLKQAAQSGYAPAEYISKMGGRLKHVHVCDHRRTPDGAIMPSLPFTGQEDWDAVRDALNAIGYDGWLMLEVYMNDYKDYEQLRQNYLDVTRFFA